MMLQNFPYQYVAATAMVAFACAYFSHAASLKVGLVDKPDERKLHDGHVPLAGGPMVFATFVIAVFAFGPPVSGVVPGMAALVLLAVVFLVGLLDDYVHLRPSVRLFIQAICGLLMPVIGGVSLHGVGDLLGFGPIELGYLAVPLTALSFAGLVNAYNMIDGADGLCASLALLPIFVLAVLAWHVGEPLWFVLATAATALGVFLVFNLGPGSRWLPKVFLGDSGSGMLGFLVCAVLVYFSQAPQMLVKPVTCLWLVAVPLMDMLATMAIRLREGHHPMRADRRHLHHMLQDLGLGRTLHAPRDLWLRGADGPRGPVADAPSRLGVDGGLPAGFRAAPVRGDAGAPGDLPPRGGTAASGRAARAAASGRGAGRVRAG